MGKPHKYENSSVNIQTVLPADHLAHLTKAAAESSRMLGNSVRFEGAGTGRTNFSIRGLGGLSELIAFHVEIGNRSVGSFARSEIETYKTEQSTVMFIPITPKSMVGYGLYRKFMNNLADAVRGQDPNAQISIVEIA